MKINLITQDDFLTLSNYFFNLKNLTLQNKGYECIDKNLLTDDDKIAILNIELILKNSIHGFSRFSNFKVNENGKTQIRFQYNWNYDGKGLPFIGVGYILLDELLNSNEPFTVDKFKEL